MSRDPDPVGDLGRQAAAGIAFSFAVLLHALVGFFYVFTGLLAPAWVALILVAVWIGLGVLVWRWRRRGPVVLAVPFVAAAVWWLALTAGDRLLGWTA